MTPHPRQVTTQTQPPWTVRGGASLVGGAAVLVGLEVVDVPHRGVAPRRAADSNRNGIRLTHLAERALMTPQAMSELVEHLVSHGYLERMPDPSDRRAKLICPHGPRL